MATVASGTRSTTYTLATASIGPFQVGYRLFDDDALNVYVNGVRSTEWTLTSNYEGGYDDAAYITFDNAVDAGAVVRIETSLTPARDEDYIAGDPTLIEKINIELARLWSALSDTKREALRSLRSFDVVDPVDGLDTTAIANAETYASNAAASASEAEASATLATDAQENLFEAWRGAWVTATDYEEGDLVREGGTTYICTSAHTSGVFSTDYAGGAWEVFAQQGASGAGTGDMLAANNLSDVDNTVTAVANLGLGRFFGSLYAITAAGDVDDNAMPSGRYWVDADASGAHPVAGVDYGLTIGRVSGSVTVFQDATVPGHGGYRRIYASSAWGAWVKLVDWSQVEDTLTDDAAKIPSSAAVVDYVATATFGAGQQYHDVAATNTGGTVYQNTTGRPIFVNIVGRSSGSELLVQVSATGAFSGEEVTVGMIDNESQKSNVSFIVSEDCYYRVSGAFNVSYWAELR